MDLLFEFWYIPCGVIFIFIFIFNQDGDDVEVTHKLGSNVNNETAKAKIKAMKAGHTNIEVRKAPYDEYGGADVASIDQQGRRHVTVIMPDPDDWRNRNNDPYQV